ncbi:hypothetical protein ACSVH5_11785 [Flavobacterium sp. RSSA_27]|uniref:hypothetical protein n=1 Tax=Flavobacterium sp. RSSA_27 TaxID=3447667 RepID=UPI003F2C7483
MKKTIYLFCLLFSTLYSIAQDKLDKVKFEKIVDYITCICINDALGNGQKNCNENIITLDEIDKSEVKTIELFNEFQTLKKSGDKNERTISFINNQLFYSTKYQKIKSFAGKRKGKNIDDIKSKINSKIEELQDNSIVSQSTHSNTTKEFETTKNYQYSANITPTESNKKSSYLDTFLIYFPQAILLLLILVQFLFFNKKIKKINSEIIELKGIKDKKNNTLDIQPSHSFQSSFFEEKFRDVYNKIDNINNELLKKINAFERNIESKENLIKESKESTTIQPKIDNSDPYFNSFYKHAPDQNGFDTKFDVPLNDAVFKFIIDKNNPNKATYELINEPKQKQLILNYPNKYIKPVFEEINALNQNARNLIVTPGVVEKRNDFWVVTQKAKIKYE